MKPALLYLLAALIVSPALAGSETEMPREMVLLTVGGLVGKSNRGPVDAKRDVLLAEHKVAFKNAFAFDRAMLLALPQQTVTAQPNTYAKPASFSGPGLRDVLEYLEAAKLKISFMALDGFTGWLVPEDIDGSDWILALSADGVPLGIGQQGPIWLVKSGTQQLDKADPKHGDWVWNVFYINIGE
ncbi:MAG: hypothetical protein AB7G54_08220 [Methyloceanibacter sp.]